MTLDKIVRQPFENENLKFNVANDHFTLVILLEKNFPAKSSKIIIIIQSMQSINSNAVDDIANNHR